MNDGPLLDSAQLDRLNEWGGPQLQRKMIELFLTHAAERMDQIKEGLESGSTEKAETGAHTLKSSAGNVGAHRVQELAARAEGLAEAGNLADLQTMVPTLEEEFQAACGALRTVLEGVAE